MKMNRVLVLNETRDDHVLFGWWTNTTFCRQNGDLKSLECYYEPLTSCTREDIFAGSGFSSYNEAVFNQHDSSIQKAIFFGIPQIVRAGMWDLPQKFIIMGSSLGNEHNARFYVPEVFRQMLKCSPIPEKNYYYWWRAVSASYLLRPNRAVQALMEAKRKNAMMIYNHRHSCVSIYVRRGDKEGEMPFVPFEQYAYAADYLSEKGMVPIIHGGDYHYNTSSNISISSKHVYLGSEEPTVFKEAKEWAALKNWTLHYHTFFDRSKLTSREGQEEQVSKEKSFSAHHDELEYFAMVFDIDNHIKCEAFVCTMKSNFCRVIEELRATVGGKANRYYVDLNSPWEKEMSEVDKNFALDWRRW
jgi:hypothetical protein